MMRIRITVHGAVYALTGFLLLAAGLIRGELLSTACGGVLTLYTGFAVAVLVFTAFYWRREEPSVIIAEDTAGTDLDDTEVHTITVTPSGAAFPRCAAGTAAFYTLSLSRTPNSASSLQVSIPLHRGQTIYREHTLPRGRYFYHEQYLALKDLCGFFAVHLLQPRGVFRTYTVVPRLLPAEHKKPPVLSTQTVQDVPQLERTAELYESRRYFPGDDPRKIHWKLYAHTGSLSIKLGAFEPPPVRHLSIYIEEPTVLYKKDQRFAAPVFDAFIGRLAALILQLLHSGIQCSLLLYDYQLYDYQQADYERSDTLQGSHNRADRAAVRPASHSGETGEPAQESEDAAVPGRLHSTFCSREHSGCRVLRRFDLQADDADALNRVLNLCAVPALQCGWTAQPDAAEVFHAVPENSGLLYCSVPLPGNTGSIAEAKVAASRHAGVQTVFYLADSPESHEVQPDAGNAAQGYRSWIGYLHRLLYTSAASAREAAFYRRLHTAAEHELQVFAARNCHAQLL